MLIGRLAGHAASAATSAFARARTTRACACFSRACVCGLARLLRARLLCSTMIFVLFARAGAAANVDEVDDYVENNCSLCLIRATYLLSMHGGIYTTKCEHTANDSCQISVAN